MNTVLAIDPGQRGAYVLLCRGQVLDYALPTQGDLLSPLIALLDKHSTVEAAVLETPLTLPGQDIRATATTHRQVGRIEGVLRARQMPLHLVSPAEWTAKVFGLLPADLRAERNVGKAKTFAALKLLYPRETCIPPGCRVPHDGLADAILIGFYWLWREGWLNIYKQQQHTLTVDKI